MQTIIKKHNYTLRSIVLAVVCFATMFTSCNNKDEKVTGVELLSYGPVPVARGAELRFIGLNLDKVTSIVLPGGIEITNFTEKTASKITLTVPQEAIPGYVVLKTSLGDITTKTKLGFSEPILLTDFSPTTIKRGAKLTINGDYLNLIGQVIFTDRITVDSTKFISKSRSKIELIVPAEAQTGKISISNGAIDPIIVYSESPLNIVLPTLSTMTPNSVVAGTNLTITGTDLDLVKSIIFGGNQTIDSAAFGTNHTATSITLTVPVNAQDGKIGLKVASGVVVQSSLDLVMTNPTITTITPNPVKNGAIINVTGTNLQLVSSVVFAGGANGTISNQTSNSMDVAVPNSVITGEVKFNTSTNKSVSGGTITIVAPTITGFAPASGKPGSAIVITGTALDVVSKVLFTGGIEGAKVLTGTTSLSVTIPVGAKTGKITLVAVNGVTVASVSDFTVLSNLPDITGYKEKLGRPGKILTIEGSKLTLIKTLIFPGDITATAYGLKSDTQIEVYVPDNVTLGLGAIKMITYEGEQGLTPQFYFNYFDDILPTTIMISNFDGGGASQSTWGSVVTFGIPSVNLNGTAAMLGLTGNGWQWTWAHNWDTRPVLANPEKYVIKFDVCITKAVSGLDAGMTLKGWTTAVSLGQPFGTSTEGYWITKTFDVLTSGMSIDGTGDWGIWINGSNYDLTGVMVDNLRFDLK